MDFVFIFGALSLMVCLVILAFHLWKTRKELADRARGLENENSSLGANLQNLQSHAAELSAYAEKLRPYSELPNAETYAAEKIDEGKSFLAEAKRLAEVEIQSAKETAKRQQILGEHRKLGGLPRRELES